MSVYLIHLERPLAHSQHYIGYTSSMRTIAARTEHHRAGTGSKFLAAVSRAGITFAIARTWKDGDRTFERKLKNRNGAKRFCPVCKSIKLLAQLLERENASA